MGLFDYLLIVSTKERVEDNKMKNFFLENKYAIVEKTIHGISLCKGNIEVLITNDGNFSIRTKIQNDVTIIDSIIAIIKLFSEKLKTDIAIYDAQFKNIYHASNLQEIKNHYFKRQESLKEYF